ncbi:MAG: glycosyltransferase [Planctomycetaceae bacterium]|nr:glycosyltransferase [Planctomycetaceae bacterium]
MMRSLRILTWHVHGNYLWYLSQARHQFYLPVDPNGGPGYGGRGNTFPFGDNVHDVPIEEIAGRSFDCILYQHRENWSGDHRWLTPAQRRLPSVYLEHDPPLDSPTDGRHWFDDPAGLMVHVTPFNALMWDSGRVPWRVIEHGVPCHRNVQYSGEIARGLTVVNHLGSRGRRLGPDIFAAARRDVPIDLVGMGSEALGGLGEVSPPRLAAFEARYRFFFNPIRYTSLGLAVCEAMMLGMPVVGLATTEMATAVLNGVTGFVDTSLDRLVEPMKRLLRDPEMARHMGEEAHRYARRRFSLSRFVRDWNAVLAEVTGVAPLHRSRRHHAKTSSTD